MKPTTDSKSSLDLLPPDTSTEVSPTRPASTAGRGSGGYSGVISGVFLVVCFADRFFSSLSNTGRLNRSSGVF